MIVSFYELSAIGILMEGMLVYRLSKSSMIRRYPYFSAFVSYDLCRSLALLGVLRLRPQWFVKIYWSTEVIALVFLFAIVWEATRHLFPPESPLRQLAWKAVLVAEAVLLPVLLFLAWGWTRSDFNQYPVLKIWPIVEQYFTLAVSLLLLVIAGLARYYGVSFGRNMRGLVAGFGVYLCLYAANFAALQTVPRFHVLWQFISSTSYSAMITCWLWAFWKFAPSQQLATSCAAPVIWKSRWSGVWQTTLSEMRQRPN